MKYSEPFLLSSTGSTRATAYGFSNKSVTLNGKTHVVWLDAVAKVCGRTYDHAAQQWGEAIAFFDGCDNHTSPSLTVDKDGFLHLVYGPHGWWGNWNQARFKWVISEEPNSIAAWRGEQMFGYSATYACMVHLPHGRDAIVYRGGEVPCSLMFQRQRELGGWSTARELVRQEITPQYTNVGGQMVCDRDGILYTACNLYNVEGNFSLPADGRKTFGLVILRSTDEGENWTDLRCEPVSIPTLYEPRLSPPPLMPYNGDRRIGGLALDSAGALWVLVSSPQITVAESLLSRWNGGEWHTIDIAPFFPDGWNPVDTMLTIDSRDHIHITATAAPVSRLGTEQVWGNPLCEVFHLVSADAGRSFSCRQVSVTDETTANWLPNISRGGVYNPVENPVILYTHGPAGVGCSPETQTEVYCVMTEG